MLIGATIRPPAWRETTHLLARLPICRADHMKFQDLDWRAHPLAGQLAEDLDGWIARHPDQPRGVHVWAMAWFRNGYGASIVSGPMLVRAWRPGLYALSVVHEQDGDVYETAVTADVERGDATRMQELLDQIAALPVRDRGEP